MGDCNFVAMKRRFDHRTLVKAGLKLHEARHYSKALEYFDRAMRITPECPVVAYNRANTLHMLGRDAEAYRILRELIRVAPLELDQCCPDAHGVSLQLDTFYLLFLVTTDVRGLCAEAFDYAAEHLRRRRRGLQSVWSIKEVRATISAMRREGKSAPNPARQPNPGKRALPCSRPSTRLGGAKRCI